MNEETEVRAARTGSIGLRPQPTPLPAPELEVVLAFKFRLELDSELVDRALSGGIVPATESLTWNREFHAARASVVFAIVLEFAIAPVLELEEAPVD